MGRIDRNSASKKRKRSIPTSTRSSRNLSEKRRRNSFNSLVDELAYYCILTKATFRPKHKLEKSVILESAVKFFKEHRVNQEQECFPAVHNMRMCTRYWQPEFLNNKDFIQIMQESLDGFSFVLDPNGQVIFVSDSISLSLGVATDQFLNSNILDFVREEDRRTVLAHLRTLKELQNSFWRSLQKTPSTINFICRMRGSHLKTNCFVPVQCLGRFLPHLPPRHYGNSTKSANQTHVRTCLLVFGKLVSPLPDKTLFTGIGNFTKFHYRLALDWKYVFVDQDVFSLLGFLPNDLLQTSAYEYIHPDDLSNVAHYHEMLLNMGHLTTCYYRHITKGNTWVWLRSTCCISYNWWNSKPESIVCSATVATYSEVCSTQKGLLENDAKRFAKVKSTTSKLSLSLHQGGRGLASGHPEKVEVEGDINASASVSVSADKSSYMSLPMSHATSNVKVDDTIVDTQLQQLHVREICLPDPNLPQGLSMKQLKVFNEILHEQTQKIIESIQDKEHQLLLIQKLMHWSQQLLEMYEKVVGLST